MNSEERRKQRFKRRQLRRRKKRETLKAYDDFDKVFTYQNLYAAYKACRKGVSWKGSVQKYITQAPLNIYRLYIKLKDGTYRSTGFYEFDITERGKKRHIKSVTIEERIVQRCLCDHAINPMLQRSFIYDNGACQKHKGYTFAIDRITKHLRDHKRRYKNKGYILLYDFTKFFDNISHKVVKEIIDKTFTDRRLKGLIYHFISMFGDKGLGLGSAISQTLALASANRLDHYIKEVLKIKGYGRYMDDGYLIHPSKAYLKTCLDKIKEICKNLGIILNPKKTQIIKLSHGFTWLKTRFYIKDKIIKKLDKKSITRQRRKLKKLKTMLDQGKISQADIYASFQSWRAHARRCNAWHTIKNMERLYNELFIDDWIAGGG